MMSDDNILLQAVTCSLGDRNTDNLLLASAIVAIFTEMNSLDQ